MPAAGASPTNSNKLRKQHYTRINFYLLHPNTISQYQKLHSDITCVPLATEPDLMGVDYNLGVVLEQLGQVDEALKHYQRAVELDTGDREAQQAVERLEK